MSIIAVDMDEVIADALGEHLLVYKNYSGKEIKRDELHGRYLRDVVPVEHLSVLQQFLFTEEFFANLAVMEGAQETLEKLSQKHTIFIATAAMEIPTSFNAKYQWLRTHFPFISPMNCVFCGDKSILNADYLIDDTARHFRTFRGQGILFDAPHNAKVEGYPRVRNWQEVDNYFAAQNL